MHIYINKYITYILDRGKGRIGMFVSAPPRFQLAEKIIIRFHPKYCPISTPLRAKPCRAIPARNITIFELLLRFQSFLSKEEHPQIHLFLLVSNFFNLSNHNLISIPTPQYKPNRNTFTNIKNLEHGTSHNNKVFFF